MSIEFEDLIHENLEIQVRDYCIRGLALHRHFPDLGEVELHNHPDNEQALLYLRGKGVQVIEQDEISVRRGSLVFLSRGIRHGFRREREQSPLCLSLSFTCPDRERWEQHTLLNSGVLGGVERHLRRLAASDNGLVIAALILEILTWIEAAARNSAVPTGPWTLKVQRILQTHDFTALTASGIAAELGQDPDVLNRHLRRESNQSTGRMLTDARLERARNLLRDSTLTIGEVAEKVGTLDPNYFSRWFRQHSGQSPSHWRASEVDKA